MPFTSSLHFFSFNNAFSLNALGLVGGFTIGWLLRDYFTHAKELYSAVSVLYARRIKVDVNEQEELRYHLTNIESLNSRHKGFQKNYVFTRKYEDSFPSSNKLNIDMDNGRPLLKPNWMELLVFDEWIDPYAMKTCLDSKDYKEAVAQARNMGFDISGNIFIPESQSLGS